MFGVSIPTVSGWCDSGILASHRTPGGHRRIEHDALLAFAEGRGVRLPRDVVGGKPRVLVVDDERDFSEMVRDYLTIKGFEVTVAATAFQAGLEIGRFKPELIVLDLQIPDANGFEMVRLLRDDPDTAGVRLLACTAFRDAAVDAWVADLELAGLIEKPVKMSALHELVSGLLDLDDEG